MKTIVLISAMSLFSGVLSVFALNQSDVANKNSEKFECKYGRCSKIKSDGYRCKNCCVEGSYYCWSHRY
jgi:hypothetical protein